MKRGEPFDSPGEGKRYAILHCPLCGEAMRAMFVAAPGPAIPADDEGLTDPCYRYVCPTHGAAEAYGSRRVEKA